MYLGTEQVHIAFQGYERERVYRPPIESNADKVILIAHNGETVSNSEESAEESIDEDISKGRACRDEVRRKLEEEDIDVDITECDFFDLNSAVLGAGDVITRCQSDNTEIYLNITTGSKITAIAGAIAATSTDATPYYVRAESYYGEQIATDIQDPQTLPQYPFSSPHRDFLRVLEFIQEESADRGYVIKREVVEFSMDLSLLSEYERSEVRHYYDPADEKVLDPLLEWGYVKMVPRGDENRYQLTDEGEDILEVLSFMLN